MADYDIPEWALRLIPPTGEPTRLNDDDYLKLDSLLPNPVRRFWCTPNSPHCAAIDRYNRQIQQLAAIRDYNRKLREQERSVSISDLPKTAEEAEAQGYVEAKVIIALFPSTFTSSSALTKYLDSEEHKDTIRCFKPSLNRRLVHAADVLKSLFLDHEAEQVAVAKVQGDKKQRRNKPGN